MKKGEYQRKKIGPLEGFMCQIVVARVLDDMHFSMTALLVEEDKGN